MGFLSRVYTFAAGTKARASEVNAELDNIISEFNGGIDNTNIAATPRIDSQKIDDYSTSDTEAITDAVMGNSASPNKASDLEGEIARLRRSLREAKVGTAAAWRNAAGTFVSCGWQELPAIGQNILKNPSFEFYSSGSGTPPTLAPDGWTLVNAPATVTTQTTATTEGMGNDLRIITNGVGEGVSQAITDVKEGGYYLVGCRAKQSVGTAQLTVSGDIVTGVDYQDGTQETTSGTYTTLATVVLVDSGPTSFTVSLLGKANTDDVKFDHAFVYELNTDPVGNDYADSTNIGGSARSGDAVAATVADGNTDDFYETSVTVPDVGVYEILVYGVLCVDYDTSDNNDGTITLQEDVDAAASWDARSTSVLPNVESNSVHTWLRSAPLNGSTYSYRFEVDANGSDVYVNSDNINVGWTWTSSIMVELRRLY